MLQSLRKFPGISLVQEARAHLMPSHCPATEAEIISLGLLAYILCVIKMW